MGMIRSRGTTLRTIIEHHHLWVFFQQLMNLAIGFEYALGLVFQRRDGKMLLQDRKGIYKQLILAVNLFLDLLLGTILLTKETRAFRNGLLIDFGTRRHHTGRIPLHLDAISSHHQFTRLGTTQVMVSLSGCFPLF